MNSDVRVFDVNMDADPLNSTITLEDSETEVIELDASCDADIICLDNENQIYDTGKSSVDRISSPDEIEVTKVMAGSRRKRSRSPSSGGVASQPVFKVMFRDENVSRQYRQQIKDFLHNLVQSKPSFKKDTNESSLILEVWDDKDNFKESPASPENKNANESVECNNICDSLFTIDKQPNAKNDLDVPTYGQKYENAFEESKREQPKDCAPKLNCFNCNGNHNMRDCPLPKNQSNINKNRKEFATKHNMGVRYHMNEDQRFSHMVPGHLSQKLRKALGLKENELPKHIYRMRLLGYPPGWLEEARLQHSGLSLFNSDGVAESDINEEEGEIITDIDRDQYDIKKIYDFPGFNIPPPPGTIDEAVNDKINRFQNSHMHWVPKMQHVHSKEMMLLHLQGKEADDGYKRKKLKMSTSIVHNNTEAVSDMEIEDTEENVVESVSINGHFVPPLPKESVQEIPAPPPELPQTIDDSDSQSQELPFLDSADDTTSITNSPSLSELERTKKVLLMEIEEANSQSNSDSTSIKNDLNTVLVSETSFSSITTTPSTSRRSSSHSSVISESQCCPDTSLKNDSNTTLTLDTSITNKILQPDSTPNRSASRRTSDQVKSVYLGTPILPSTSPYNKLPSSEKFSRDICDVINFENLPDSTGKYEQMTGVLQKVRNTMAKLQQQE
ncbi:zinc finger CCHC domain-containing protein 8 homolog [Pogonomyrmex barbatus]|uniref:Zinc finger CCHC domain-containing protein 8 homolog n=1 Tax=Pogonomyrmex barbatus TaxID=144034 RepID=A0A6I9WRV4_9HYME|nr:zinc finger CCHC domain-containing protein 8 homolog [Pogonomyrmex barbatus]